MTGPRLALLLLILSPVPFLFNSCAGNLLGGATFSSSTCNLGLKQALTAKSAFLNPTVFKTQKARLAGERIPAGSTLAVVVDNSCLQNRALTPAEKITRALPNTHAVADLPSQAYTWVADQEYLEAELNAQVATEPCVLGIAPNQTYQVQGLSFNDPLQANQTTYLNADNALSAYGSFYGNKIGMPPNDGVPVVIAVIDTGADYTHPDLSGSMWAGGDFGIGVDIPAYTSGKNGNFYPSDVSSIGHGTHVTGMIAATSNNQTGITGVMPYNASVMSIRLFQDDGTGTPTTTSSNFYSAVQFAVAHGAQVINLSLGSISSGAASDPVSLAAIQAAVQAGVTVVVVIGNADSGNGVLIDGVTTSSIPGMFATIPGVIGVGAYDTTTLQKSYFSHYSTTFAEISAPGEESPSSGLFSTLPQVNGSYGRLSGTSQAAPQVSAAAALAIGLIKWSYVASPTPAQVENLLLASATPNSALAPYFKNGNMLNLAGLVQTIRQTYPLTATGGHISQACD